MTSDLAKTYDPAAIEKQVYDLWLRERAFHAEPDDPGQPYCIVIPPPNVTGALHLGHAINNTLQDILIRQHRMMGRNTVWIPGIDHAGIATQAVVEKELKEKENKTRHDVGRDELVRRIWAWKQQYGDRIIEQLKRLGCSCDWDRTRFTLDEQCARAVRETFFKLFKDGLIYRGKRLVNWDVHLQTSISDDEIYHETVKTSLWYIRYPIEGTDKSMVVATTRPETMLGDTAVAVHPEDPRWNWAIGKQVRLPLVNRLIPIIADDILVDPKFGTGCVKVTPAHDPNDYACWQRHLGKPDQIKIINILNPDGTLNENAGPYKSMQREAARKRVVDDLTGQGLLVKEEPYETQVGHSDRSKTPIEPYLSDQWFVKMADLAERAIRAVRDGRIRFFPERHAQQYLSWLSEKRDWPISRQLWWGHRIPVWSKRRQKPNYAGDQQTIEFARMLETLDDLDVAAHRIEDHGDGTETIYLCYRNNEDAKDLARRGFVQDPDVLDTWFSSALWPHSTLGWPQQTPELKKWYPTNVLVTNRDIITLWVARMVMTGLYNMQDIPFHHVHVHATILDGKGERMSKSKGNGVDPVDIIESHGADALRFTLTHMATETQDVRMPVKKLPNGKNTSEKFDLGRNFCNKLWNASRFVLSALEQIGDQQSAIGNFAACPLADRWIVSRFNSTVAEVNDALANYRFDQYARSCYDFFWRDFCDWYVEASKPALKDPARAAQTANVLASVLDGALRLMHPVIPFITEFIWQRLCQVRPERGIPRQLMCCASQRLIRAAWPVAGPTDPQAENIFARLQQIIQAIRNLRNEHKVDAKKTVSVWIRADGESVGQIHDNRGLIELLATCSIRQAGSDIKSPTNAVRALAAGCEIFIEGLVDTDAENKRLARRREELTRLIASLKSRLNNVSYVAKAPPNLVQQTREQLAEAEAELKKIAE